MHTPGSGGGAHQTPAAGRGADKPGAGPRGEAPELGTRVQGLAQLVPGRGPGRLCSGRLRGGQDRGRRAVHPLDHQGLCRHGGGVDRRRGTHHARRRGGGGGGARGRVAGGLLPRGPTKGLVATEAEWTADGALTMLGGAGAAEGGPGAVYRTDSEREGSLGVEEIAGGVLAMTPGPEREDVALALEAGPGESGVALRRAGRE